MTNEQIILSNRIFLMEQEVIKGIPGTSITVKDDDGVRTVLMPEEIYTFDEWKKRGRIVRKGQHAVAKFQIWMPKKKKAKDADADADTGADEAPKGFYKKVTAFFTEEQTKEI